MGRLTPTGNEHATVLSEAVLAAAGDVSPTARFRGDCNVAISGDGVGTVILERSFDGGTVWVPMTSLASVVTFTAPASPTIRNLEEGVLHRARFATRTSGSFSVRFSQ